MGIRRIFVPFSQLNIMSKQYLVDPILLLESDKSKEVTFPMQSSINPSLVLEGDASFDYVLSISSSVPYE